MSATRRLLLVSSSRVHGRGYLDHCEHEVRELFAGAGGPLLFVPWALHDLDGYAGRARARFAELGLELGSIHRATDPAAALAAAAGVFIGGGNTFRLLAALASRRLIGPLRRRVLDGLPYLGTSAGSNVACPTVRTTNDMPIVEPPSLDALGLVGFQLNPHYLDPDPGSTHMGETRDQRLAEYLEENPGPVIALRETAMLRVRGASIVLLGDGGAKLFARGEEPREVQPGSELSDLLEPR